MIKTKKRKAAPPSAATRKRRRSGSSGRSSSGSSAPRKAHPKRTRGALSVVVSVPDVRIDSPELEGLSDRQRIELGSFGQRYRSATRPNWAVDESAWRKAVRHVRPYWSRYEQPYAVAGFVYLKMGGAIGAGEAAAQQRLERESAGGSAPRSRARSGSERGSDREPPVHVEAVQLDELGYDAGGTYYGSHQGPLWRVFNAGIDSVVRAATAAGARAIVLGTR